MFLPIALLLLCGTVENIFRSQWVYCAAFALLFIVFFGAIVHLCRDVGEKKTLYKDGNLLEGVITDLEEIRYGDYVGYEVTIEFMDSMQTRVIVNRTAEFEVGKKMLILYLNEKNFAVM